MTVVLPFPTPLSLPFTIYEADAFHPPLPPAGAHAVEVRDESGRVIHFEWSDPIVDKELASAQAFRWSERLAPLLVAMTQKHDAAG